jgi:plasmid stabilization system protein ParE
MRFHKLLPIAEQELAEAIDFYDKESRELGDRFIVDFDTVIERLCHYPESAPRVSKWLRIARLSGFPYNIIYRINPDHILVTAVAHQSRRPRYWRGRI